MKAVFLLKIKRISLYFISKTRFYFSNRTELGSSTGMKRCWNLGSLVALHYSLHKMNSPLIFGWRQEALPKENNHPGEQPATNLQFLNVPTAKSKRNLSQHLRDRWMWVGGVGACQGLQLRRLRSAGIDTRWLGHTNLIQIPPRPCDCFHQIRYSTWCTACASFGQDVERQTMRMNSLKDRAEQSATTQSISDLCRLNSCKMVSKLRTAALGYTGPQLCIAGP